MEKICSKCLLIKDLSEFYKNKKYGYYSMCKKCFYNLYCKSKRKEIKENYGLGCGTVNRYGFKLSLEIYEKFERKCKECGSENDLTIHHLDHKGRNYWEKGLERNDSKENLVLLCRACHGRLHSIERWKERRSSENETSQNP
jgi:hypothetical protein